MLSPYVDVAVHAHGTGEDHGRVPVVEMADQVLAQRDRLIAFAARFLICLIGHPAAIGQLRAVRADDLSEWSRHLQNSPYVHHVPHVACRSHSHSVKQFMIPGQLFLKKIVRQS